jgi:diamine N-acetyltransferase
LGEVGGLRARRLCPASSIHQQGQCMNYHIRQAEVRDYAALHHLMKEFSIFIKTPEKFKITIEQMLKEREYIHSLVAEDDDHAIVGYATYFMAYYTWSGKSMYLDDLYVVDTCRGAGIGTRLIEGVIAKARQEECAKLKWQVTRWNRPAIAFYKKLGAVIDDVEINCDLHLR